MPSRPIADSTPGAGTTVTVSLPDTRIVQPAADDSQPDPLAAAIGGA